MDRRSSDSEKGETLKGILVWDKDQEFIIEVGKFCMGAVYPSRSGPYTVKDV